MKAVTEFDKKFLGSLGVIAAIDLFFLTVDTGLLGETILVFTIPLFMLILGYDLSMMTIYEVTDSDRGVLTYIAGFLFVHLMDLRTIILNNKGVYAWEAPTFEKVELMPALLWKVILLLIGVFAAFGFGSKQFSGEIKRAFVSNIVYWIVTGFSSSYAIVRLLILTDAQWFADTRPYSPRGNFRGAEAFLTISIGLIVMAIGVGSWVNVEKKKGRMNFRE